MYWTSSISVEIELKIMHKKWLTEEKDLKHWIK